MQVSRLEIFGFKSFMERLILPLKGGVTGVVGPNGCGKSNIVDALRWVLGETNARSLRGGLLEDVIFNGTDQLRPLGLAEVSLTVTASGASLYEDILQLSREGELQAELEEADAQIESVDSHLKKARALEDSSRDTQSGDDDHKGSDNESSAQKKFTVIQGGAANSRSDDLQREASVADEGQQGSDQSAADIEEAQVGQAAKEATEEVDTGPQALQQKFGWLRGVSEVQVTRRLYRSGEAEFFINRSPCRLRDMKEFFRVVGISARTFTIVAQGEVSRIITSKPEQRRQIFEEAAGVLGLREKIAASERRLKDTADNVARLADIEREVERQVAILKRQANRAIRREGLKKELHESEFAYFGEKRARLAERKERIGNHIQDLEKRERDLSHPTGSHDSDSGGNKSAATVEEALRNELLNVEIVVEELRARLDTLKEEANQRGRKEQSLKGTQHELKVLFEAKGTEGKRIHERLQTLLERQGGSDARIQELQEKEQLLQSELDSLENKSSDTLQVLDKELRELRQHIRGQEERIQGKRDELRKLEGRLDATRKQLREHSRHALLDHEGSGELKSLLERAEGALPKVLAELIEVEGEYTKALQSAIGERASYFVVKNTEQIALAFEQYGSKKGVGQPGFWYGLLKHGSLPEPISATPDGASRTLPTYVRSAEEVVRALSKEYEPLISRLLSGVFIALTLEDGLRFFREGAAPVGSLVVTVAGERVTNDEVALPQMGRGLIDMQAEISRLTSERDGLNSQFEVYLTEIAQLKTVLEEKEQAHGEALRASQEREQAVRELSRELGSVRGLLQAERRSKQQYDHDIARAKEYDTELQNRIVELEEKQRQVTAELQALLQEDASGLHQELRELGAQLGSKDNERRTLRERFEQVRKQAEAERRMIDELRQQLSTKKLDLERCIIEEEHLAASFVERIPDEVRALLEERDAEAVSAESKRLSDGEFQSIEKRVADIRAQLLREGEVDPSSIEQFEVESKRLEELQAQRQDLESASHTLKRTVKLLREQSVTRFLHTFEQVRENFIKLMPRLFGGGSADLELTASDDPLESGILITVRPPGKKPKSLDLLSGGEKALCATALIVSLFLVRPSPVCVLDEVDAPLDEANLVRFLSLIKEMSSHTQFLMITHNKASMSAADRLVGVTMQKPGASTVLQVSLEEAYQHVA